MQLVAYGAQDVYLTGNPQITFFKVVYRRHTNFSIEAIEQTFNGTADFGKKVTCTVSRNGDLIHKTFLQVTLPALTASGGEVQWVDKVGHQLLSSVELEIGGQSIDKHYRDWFNIWNELSLPEGLRIGYDVMIGATPDLTTPATSLPSKTLYVPLIFWFNLNPGLSLPLIALQYHEVRINIDFARLQDLIITSVPVASGSTTYTAATAGQVSVSGGSIGYASLYVDYIYLDTDERRRFAQVSHEYLIQQLQFTGDESVTSTSNKIRLNFNHPTKELLFAVRTEVNEDANLWTNYTVPSTVGGHDAVNPIAAAKLTLNGHDRFSERAGPYFNLVQPFQYHSNIPKSRGINVYSFALKPEEHQPSGTCNFSRIDNATLNLTLLSTVGQAKVIVYATNYNVLRIMSGMGGLAYSN